MLREGRPRERNSAAAAAATARVEEGEAREENGGRGCRGGQRLQRPPGRGGAGEAEPEMEPIPGSEAGTDPPGHGY